MSSKSFYLIGYASNIAGAPALAGTQGSAEGPLTLQAVSRLNEPPFEWKKLLTLSGKDEASIVERVANLNTALAKEISVLVQHKQLFCVIGGDHTSAIGTWSGVYDALHTQGEIGLIWIDAHMDSHTPQTSRSGRLHGMPLACLLGYGDPTLTAILHAVPKLKPQHVCLIGVRSFEQGEENFLRDQKVRIYYMEEVNKRGLTTVLQEAVEHISKKTIAYGFSIDIDSLDPTEAPGVGVPEPGGIKAQALYEALMPFHSDPKWIGAELTEFDPSRDKEQKTEKILIHLLKTMANIKNE